MKYKIREYRPGHFQVYFQHEGKQIFLQKLENGMPLDSKAMAGVLIIHLKRDGYDPRRFNQDKEFRFDVAVKTWIDLSTCSEEWLSERKRIADKFLIPFFGKKDIREIQTIHVNQFEKSLRDKGLSPAYIRNIRDELRSFLRFNKDSIPKLPEFRKLEVQSPMIKWLTPEDQDQVFENISKRHIPIFTLLRTYPIRPNEACGLKWDGVFMDSEIPYFLVKDVVSKTGIFKSYTKTKKIRPYPILEEIAWIFQRDGNEFVFNRDGKPYTGKVLYDIWREANLKTPGVQRVSLYGAMKHSFGWNRIEQGYSLEDVALLMGHSSSSMTRRYAGQTLKRMAEILRGNVHRTLLSVQEPKLLELKGNSENRPWNMEG
jgi:integrase